MICWWCVWITLLECLTSFVFSHGFVLSFFFPLFNACPGFFSFSITINFRSRQHNNMIPVCCEKGRSESPYAEPSERSPFIAYESMGFAIATVVIFWQTSFCCYFFFGLLSILKNPSPNETKSMGTFSMCSREMFTAEPFYRGLSGGKKREEVLSVARLIERSHYTLFAWAAIQDDVFVISFNLSIHLCLFVYGLACFLVRAVHTLDCL